MASGWDSAGLADGSSGPRLGSRPGGAAGRACASAVSSGRLEFCCRVATATVGVPRHVLVSVVDMLAVDSTEAREGLDSGGR